MWVARDKDGELVLYKGKPVRGSLDKDKWVSFGVTWENFTIDESLFPSLKWEDEPLEVALIPQTALDNFIQINEKEIEEHRQEVIQTDKEMSFL